MSATPASLAAPRSRVRVIILVLVVLAVAGWQGYTWLQHRADRTRVTATGTLEVTTVEVAAEIPGRLRDIPAKEGDQVKAGDVLARLDDTTFQAQLLEAQSAKVAADAAVIDAAAKQTLADRDLARARDLFAQGFVARQSVDRAEQVAQSASAQVVAAKANAVRAARTVETLTSQWDKTVLRAPRAGTVTEVYLEPGETVTPGLSILQLADLTDPWMRVFVAAGDIGRVHLGQRATVTMDGLPKHPLDGEVTWIASEAQFTPRNVATKAERTTQVYAVKVRVHDPDRLLKPGMTGDILIETGL